MSLRTMSSVVAALLALACSACSGAESGVVPETNTPDAARNDAPDAARNDTPDATGTACTDSTQCPTGFGCAYPVGGGCAAAGTCEPTAPGCTDGVVCACDGTALPTCTFVDPNVLTKPTPVSAPSPPSPPQDGVTESAWCKNAIAHTSDAGCGFDVELYQCSPVAPEAGGCAETSGDGSTGVYYPIGCTALLPGCTAPTSPRSPLSCYCMSNVIGADSGAGWVCPD
jgi:hypothetical protein